MTASGYAFATKSYDGVIGYADRLTSIYIRRSGLALQIASFVTLVTIIISLCTYRTGASLNCLRSTWSITAPFKWFSIAARPSHRFQVDIPTCLPTYLNAWIGSFVMSVHATRLEDSSDSLTLELGQDLWSWEPCAQCQRSQPCTSKTCPSGRSSQLGRIYQYYTAVFSTYIDAADSHPRLLTTHKELFKAISQLKSHPNATRAEFCQLAFPPTCRRSALRPVVPRSRHVSGGKNTADDRALGLTSPIWSSRERHFPGWLEEQRSL